MFKVLIFLVVGYIIFEIIEHLIIPLVALMTHRKRHSMSGAEGMIGEVGEVREWSGKEGKIFIHGELWNAESEFELSQGEKAIIQSMEGLVLRVKPLKEQEKVLKGERG